MSGQFGGLSMITVPVAAAALSGGADRDRASHREPVGVGARARRAVIPCSRRPAVRRSTNACAPPNSFRLPFYFQQQCIRWLEAHQWRELSLAPRRELHESCVFARRIARMNLQIGLQCDRWHSATARHELRQRVPWHYRRARSAGDSAYRLCPANPAKPKSPRLLPVRAAADRSPARAGGLLCGKASPREAVRATARPGGAQAMCSAHAQRQVRQGNRDRLRNTGMNHGQWVSVDPALRCPLCHPALSRSRSRDAHRRPSKASRKVAGEACVRCDRERTTLPGNLPHAQRASRRRNECRLAFSIHASTAETGPRAQGLLGRPQCLGRGKCSAHQQPCRVDAAFSECRRIRRDMVG